MSLKNHGLYLLTSLLPFLQSPAQAIQGFVLKNSTASLPPSNSVDVISVSRDTVWFGTGRGLAFTSDGEAWVRFEQPFDGKGISAIAINDTIVCAAIGFTTTIDGNAVQTGGGINWSIDRGLTWTHIPQPVDTGSLDTLLYGNNRIPALPITVSQQNIIYDIALTRSTIWIASFAGMLRKSSNAGQTWERVILPPDHRESISPSDILDFDLAPSSGSFGLRSNLNHRVFSVHASTDSVLWVGTAAGINRTTDGGISWQRFSHQTQGQPLSGNFVVAIAEQRLPSKAILWASTVNALDPDERAGISTTDDGGTTWNTTLLDERVHNFAFKDSIVYAAADRGIFRSSDLGATWTLNTVTPDPVNRQQFTSPTAYAVGTVGDTVWVAGPDGIASTVDTFSQPFGSTWRVFRAFVPVSNTNRTYSYPSPFSPHAEVVRIHFAVQTSGPVTIRIFDFDMLPVRTLIQNEFRTGPMEYDEIWDGTGSHGSVLANGVYFYRIHLSSGNSMWGKILLIR